MKKLLLIFLFSTILISFSFSHSFSQCTTTKIADNLRRIPDQRPKINNNDDVVWRSWDGFDYEIFLYDGTNTTQITDNSYDDIFPKINNIGYVVWQGRKDGLTYEIFLYDGTTTTQITDNSYSDQYPQINNNNYVVWQGLYESHYWIFLYDGTTTTQISNNAVSYAAPQINDNNYVVWQGSLDSEIFLYDGTTTIQIGTTTNSSSDGYPQINNNGHVVWQGSDGLDSEIFLYDGTTTTRITDNSYHDSNPQINNNGDVVWKGYYDDCVEVFLHDGKGITQISNNSIDDICSRLTSQSYLTLTLKINDNGYVVWDRSIWYYRAGLLLYEEIFLYDGTGTSQIINEGQPHFPGVAFDINDNDYVVWDGEAVSGEGHGVQRTFCANQTIPRYRLYNPYSGHHHYTTDQNEYNVLGTLGWIQEETSCSIYEQVYRLSSVEAVPYYRLYNPNSFEHHWTTDVNEYNVLGTLGWIQEGADGYVFPSQVAGSEPFYRLYNSIDGLHHWTMDSVERTVLIGYGWIDEGIACYVFP